MKNVARKFEAILREHGVPEKIQSDKGTEFQVIRKQLSVTYGFRVFHTYNREIKAAHAERFIQTLKQMIRRVLTVTNGYNYERFLPTIVTRYNKLPHKALNGLSPKEVYAKGKKINKRKELKRILNNNFKKRTRHVLKKGTKVRIVRAKNSVFDKSSLQRWTTERFVIDKVLLYDPVVYTLRNLKGESITGIFYREELQRATK